ncbi:hypothetical protein [Vulcanisaeta distributa]|uniref:hypothetical protein n=1 Tax=Vulcanisaeta distributa TaxID=164451 RepID=UPI001FB4CDBD|nr:hypothetical protein [Vulcanisaeta distributa]
MGEFMRLLRRRNTYLEEDEEITGGLMMRISNRPRLRSRASVQAGTRWRYT